MSDTVQAAINTITIVCFIGFLSIMDSKERIAYHNNVTTLITQECSRL